MTSNVRKNFQRNLNNYLKANKMNQADLSEKLGVSSATTSDWSTGKKVPKMDRIEEVAKILGVTSSDMLADENEAKIYYLDRQAREVADEISKNRDLKLLFDAAQDVSANDLKSVAEILKSLKKKERGDEQE